MDFAGGKLPAEYRGLARVFRQQVECEDHVLGRVLVAILEPLRARLERHPNRGLRAEQVAAAVRRYRGETPATFRIGAVTVVEHPRRFSIEEQRLAATWHTDLAWENGGEEVGVAVCTVQLALRDGVIGGEWHALALVSLHALGRRLERGADPSYAALFADLADTPDSPQRVVDRHALLQAHVAEQRAGYFIASKISARR
jgi:hypothetical protein